MSFLLGIDVGTSGTKALIIGETGEQICLGSCSYDISVPSAGFAEQDCDMLWNATCTALRKVLNSPDIISGIVGIGITGQMHGLVLLDKDKKPLRKMILWADQRSSRQVSSLRGIGLEERVGNPVACGFFLPSLLWVKEHEPRIYGAARYAILPKDYIRFRLCGVLGTDYSDASGTLLFDLTKNEWDEKTLTLFSIKKMLLPVCHDSCEISGNITAQCSEETGLPEGIPVVYGGGDTPMQLIGNGVIRKGQLCTNIGTASQINCICERPFGSKQRLNIFRHIIPESWILTGASLNGGLVLKWLKNVLYENPPSFCSLSEMAEDVPAGSKGLVLLPFFCGERSPYMDENAKAIMYGMTLAHGRKEMIRSGMESVVYSLRDCMSVYHEIGLPVSDQLIASGGGSKSPVWLQMQADILQKVVHTTEGEENASKGAAIAAGVGCGIYASLQEACEVCVAFNERIYEPNPENRSVYDEQFDLYRQLYKNNQNLWKTPQ